MIVLVSHFSRYPSITKRVSVPGRKVRSSQCGIFLNSEKAPHPVAAQFGLDMDVVHHRGGKIKLSPMRFTSRSSGFLVGGIAVSHLSPCPFSGLGHSDASEDQFLLVGLQVVVVPEHFARDDLGEVINAFVRHQAVLGQLAGQPCAVQIGQFRFARRQRPAT